MVEVLISHSEVCEAITCERKKHLDSLTTVSTNFRIPNRFVSGGWGGDTRRVVTTDTEQGTGC